jgi:hypothetical protein
MSVMFDAMPVDLFFSLPRHLLSPLVMITKSGLHVFACTCAFIFRIFIPHRVVVIILRQRYLVAVQRDCPPAIFGLDPVQWDCLQYPELLYRIFE